MSKALWIIAVCEVIRALQNVVPMVIQIRNSKNADKAYAEFIRHLNQTDKEFVKEMLEEFEKESKA